MRYDPTVHDAVICSMEAERGRILHQRLQRSPGWVELWFVRKAATIVRHFSRWQLRITASRIAITWKITSAIGAGRVGPYHGVTSAASPSSVSPIPSDLHPGFLRGYFESGTDQTFGKDVATIVAFQDRYWSALAEIATSNLAEVIAADGYIPMLHFFSKHAIQLRRVASGKHRLMPRNPHQPLSSSQVVQSVWRICGDSKGSLYQRVGTQGIELWPQGEPHRFVADAAQPYTVANLWYDNRTRIPTLLRKMRSLARNAGA